jgi:hypothetical protein
MPCKAQADMDRQPRVIRKVLLLYPYNIVLTSGLNARLPAPGSKLGLAYTNHLNVLQICAMKAQADVDREASVLRKCSYFSLKQLKSLRD